MEARLNRPRAALLIIFATVVLIRIPFLHQAVQGDDVYYIAIARNVSADPLHPMQMGYTFQGTRVSMAGHPHPPLNAYILAALMRIFGGVRELPFHLAYLIFSLVAAAAMYSLACRFTEHALLATLVFVSVPAFVVNGNSLEADLPFLAFWMAGFAFYFNGDQRLAAITLAVAALGAYQAVFAVPILAHHAWYRRRRSRGAWIAVFAAPACLACWQLFQRLTSGRVPARVLAGYLSSYGLLALEKKFHSAVALTAHLGWTVFPAAALFGPVWSWGTAPVALAAAFGLVGYSGPQRILLAVSLLAGLMMLARWAADLWRRKESEDGMLAAWGIVFFTGSIVVFFAGSARYLLPLAAPAVLTIVRGCSRPRLLWPAAALNLALGLSLAAANYQYCNQYRQFAAAVKPFAGGSAALWSGAEWGLRYYLEQLGAEPLESAQPVYAGAVVVESELAGKIPFAAGGGRLRRVSHREVWSGLPIRLIGIGAGSGYSSSEFGVLPFDLGGGLIDRVSAETVAATEPRLAYLRMNDPDAAAQLISGFYNVESNAWRWMARDAAAVLKAPAPPPDHPLRFEMTLYIPDVAPARRVIVTLDGATITEQTYSKPGRYTLTAPVSVASGATPQVTISVDKSFQPPGDARQLGMVVMDFGLR